MPLLSSNLALAVHQSPNVHGSREHDDTEFVKESCVCVREEEKEGEREKTRKAVCPPSLASYGGQ